MRRTAPRSPFRYGPRVRPIRWNAGQAHDLGCEALPPIGPKALFGQSERERVDISGLSPLLLMPGLSTGVRGVAEGGCLTNSNSAAGATLRSSYNVNLIVV